jgi:hypothetical protein
MPRCTSTMMSTVDFVVAVSTPYYLITVISGWVASKVWVNT